MDKKEELKSLLKETFSDEIKSNIDGLKKAQDEKFKAVESKVNDITKRIEKIEALPADKNGILSNVKGTNSEIYKGYRLANMGRDLVLHKVAKNPKAFPIFSDEEKLAEYSKWMIDIVKARFSLDPEAAADLKKFYQEKAAMQEGTASEGGYLVPDEFTDEILAFAREKSFALQLCRIWPMSTDVRRIPAESGAVSVAWTAEESPANQSEPTLAEVVLTAKRLDAYSEISNELLQDSAVDIVSWLTELFAEAIGQELDNQVLNGTGDPTSGILTAAAGTTVTMDTGETNFSSISADDLSNMISKISAIRRTGAQFILHRTVLHYIRTLKDSNGDYIYAKPGQGVPPRIWEYPYIESEKAPSSSGADTAFVAFGDLRYFALGRRLQAMSLDIDPYGLFTKYQTRVRIVNRWALAIGLANAFVRLKTAAS